MWQTIISLLFPKRCIECHNIIPDFQFLLCESCKHKLPFHNSILTNENMIFERINNIIKIEYSSSLLIFKKDNITQNLIHHLKYKNYPEIGEWLADIWFDKNKDNEKLKEIDIIIPVPIHKKRLKERGYNQVSSFSQKLATLMNCKYDESLLIRTQHLSSQTLLGKYDRLERLKNAFEITRKEENKHFLLIDDVITTGATVVTCSQKLIETRKNRISILTLCSAN